jgi:hypothetical protein
MERLIFINERNPNSTIVSKKSGKRIAHFVDGKFETKNPIIIEKLKKHFKFMESPKVITPLIAFIKLRQEASEKGINTNRMKKKDIEKALEALKKGVDKNE